MRSEKKKREEKEKKDKIKEKTQARRGEKKTERQCKK